MASVQPAGAGAGETTFAGASGDGDGAPAGTGGAGVVGEADTSLVCKGNCNTQATTTEYFTRKTNTVQVP